MLYLARLILGPLSDIGEGQVWCSVDSGVMFVQ